MSVGSWTLYKVEVVDGVDIVAAVVGARSQNKPTDLETWHRRFGHGDVRVIKLMMRKDLVYGLQVISCTLNGMCEDCIYEKIVWRPFDEEVVPEGEPLERVSLNLWGKARIVSCGGAVYMMLCSDGGTSLHFPYFLASKTAAEVLAAF